MSGVFGRDGFAPRYSQVPPEQKSWFALIQKIVEDIAEGNVRATELIVGNVEAPSDGDFRWKITVSTTGQITLTSQTFDTSWDNGRWVEAGEQRTISETEVSSAFIENLGSGGGTSHQSHKYDQHAFTFRNAWAFDDTTGTPKAAFAQFSDGDATPDVDGRVCWKTANTSPTTITAFDHGQNSNALKHVFVLKIGDDNTTIDFSSSQLEGNDGTARTFQEGDLLFCVRMGGVNAGDDVTVCAVPQSPGQGPTLLASETVSGASSIDFTGLDTSKYSQFKVFVDNMFESGTGDDLDLQIYDNGTLHSGGVDDYEYQRDETGGGGSSAAWSTGNTVITLCADVDLVGVHHLELTVSVSGGIRWEGFFQNGSSAFVGVTGFGRPDTSVTVDGVRLIMSNMEGTARIYGIP